MTRRLFALTIVLAVTLAPLLANVCEARCARHVGHRPDVTAAASGEHHHHAIGIQDTRHHAASDDSGLDAISGVVHVAHACDHRNLVNVRTRAARPLVPDVALSAAATTEAVGRTPSFIASGIRHGPPGPIRSTSALRI